MVTAKQVVKEFRKQRSDVNESTIRSTLYQVSRKQKPTVIDVDGQKIPVYVIKMHQLITLRLLMISRKVSSQKLIYNRQGQGPLGLCIFLQRSLLCLLISFIPMREPLSTTGVS